MKLPTFFENIFHLWYFTNMNMKFSPTWPCGPSWSVSHRVCSYVCILYVCILSPPMWFFSRPLKNNATSLKHSKPAISERLKKSANVINCSLDQIIKLVKCEECEFIAKNKGLTWHVRKHHDVLESGESEANNSTKKKKEKN